MEKIWIVSSTAGFFIMFALLYWIIDFDFYKSLIISVCVALVGMVAEYLLYILFSWYQKTISKKKNNE
jgi:hypothetical protein